MSFLRASLRSFCRSFCLVAALGFRLTLRGYLSQKAALLGAILLLLLGLPLSLRLASQEARLLGTPMGGSVVAWMTLGVFTLVALTPLVSAAALPTASDPTRLRAYPIPPHALAAALAVGSVAELTSVLVLPHWVVLARYGGLVGGVALVLLLACALLTGQGLLFLGGQLARQRRVRETLPLLIPFALAFILFLAARQPARAAPHALTPRTLTLPSPPSALALTPPGLAAQSLGAGAGLPLLGLTLWLGASLAVAGSLAGASAEREAGERPGAPRLSPFGWLSTGAVGVMAAKELTYYLREPTFRTALSRSSASLVLVGMIALYPSNAPRLLWDSLLGTGGVLLSLFWILERTSNLWGVESAAGRLLWSFPGARWRWVVGKNLALLPLLLLLEAACLAEYGAIVHTPLGTLLRFYGLGALWLLNLLALGNVMSARFPFPLLGSAAAQSAGQSFGTGLLYLGVALAAAYLAALPFAPLWTLALLGGSIALAGRLLLSRETQVIAALED